MRHIVIRSVEAHSKCQVDSAGKSVLNWMRQENSRAAFEIARDKTSRLDLAFQALESKAGVLAGFLAVILAAVFGFIATRQPQPMLSSSLVIFLAGVCLLLLCLLFLVLCLTTRPWVDAPGWQHFDSTEEYGRDPARYRCQQIADMGQAWEVNAAVLRRKGVLVAHAVWLMFAGIICLAIAAATLLSLY